jgi:homoserine dehydrogenase
MFYGRGAGGDPSATSVVGDIVHVARHLAHAHAGMVPRASVGRRIRPMAETMGQYYLNLHVEDRPGVLAEIAECFGRHGVSIERVWQEGFGEEATLVFITHRAREGDFQSTVAEVRGFSCVRAVSSLLRVEGEE